MTFTGKDRAFMRMAKRLALKGRGKTSPNPIVGAVVVCAGGQDILGRGFHARAGAGHAEVGALTQAGSKAKGATLYVTLEPCSHFGRTPPCTDLIIKSGIKKVIVGANDPNPLVSGKGIRKLRRTGIEVLTGLMAEQCTLMNQGYNKFITTGMPFVTLKLASTLDGKIAGATGASRWITGERARRLVHKMRAGVDALLIGSTTAVKDDPVLNVRSVKGSDPVRVILDSALRLPLSARILKTGGAQVIIYTTSKAPSDKLLSLRALGVKVVKFAPTADGISIKRVLRNLAGMGITSLMIEGGGVVAASALKAGVVDKVCLFYAPKIIGGDGVPMIAPLGIRSPSSALALEDVKVKKLGLDMFVEGYVSRRIGSKKRG